jgi:Tfp pilus assembly protein FimV
VRAASEAPVAVSPAKISATGTKTYQPKAGETLDQVIAKTMGASPLSMGILRQAFVDQNPQAIIAGKVPKLRKGATLNLPDHDLLLRGVLASVTPVAAQSESSPRPAPSTPEDRKRWVKFP